jgi:hypothetical protein
MLGHGEARLPFNVDLMVRNLCPGLLGQKLVWSETCAQDLCVNANGNQSTVESVTGRESESNVPRALELFKELTALVSLTRECLGASRNRMKQFADQKRYDLEFAVGEQLFLSIKYLRLKLLGESSKYIAK